MKEEVPRLHKENREDYQRRAEGAERCLDNARSFFGRLDWTVRDGTPLEDIGRGIKTFVDLRTQCFFYGVSDNASAG